MLARVLLKLVIFTMPVLATAQTIKGVLFDVDVKRARTALLHKLGPAEANSYLPKKNVCEFPPCTDVQARFAEFERPFASSDAIKKVSRIRCEGRRENPWTCHEPRSVAFVASLAREIVLFGGIADGIVDELLEFLKSDCYELQRRTQGRPWVLQEGSKMVAWLFAVEQSQAGIRVSAMDSPFSAHSIDVVRVAPGADCTYRIASVGRWML